MVLFIDMIIVTIESYAYNYASSVVFYPRLVDKIREINPDCEILFIDSYNPLNGVVLEIGQFVVNVGDYFNQLIDIINGLYDGVSKYETKSFIVFSHRHDDDSWFILMSEACSRGRGDIDTMSDTDIIELYCK